MLTIIIRTDTQLCKDDKDLSFLNFYGSNQF